jgi:hypothetical protein
MEEHLFGWREGKSVRRLIIDRFGGSVWNRRFARTPQFIG